MDVTVVNQTLLLLHTKGNPFVRKHIQSKSHNWFLVTIKLHQRIERTAHAGGFSDEKRHCVRTILFLFILCVLFQNSYTEGLKN